MTSSYLPPDPVYDRVDLLEYMSDTCDQILADDPNAEIIIAGDIMLKSQNWKPVIRDFVF